jgi:hypothetical protein
MRKFLLAGLFAIGLLAPAAPTSSAVAAASLSTAQDRYCLQGDEWGYPGNCQFSTYSQCMATASGTSAYCGINPQYAYTADQRRGFRPSY